MIGRGEEIEECEENWRQRWEMENEKRSRGEVIQVQRVPLEKCLVDLQDLECNCYRRR